MPGESQPTVMDVLDAFEAGVVTVRPRWWHLLYWSRSPIRPLVERFRLIELQARAALNNLVQLREHDWAEALKEPSQLTFIGFLMTFGRNQDKANAVMSRLERVRFILASKEGEEHSKRGVALGWIGVLLGLLSVVLSVLSLR
jgi:hypothetical protein